MVVILSLNSTIQLGSRIDICDHFKNEFNYQISNEMNKFNESDFNRDCTQVKTLETPQIIIVEKKRKSQN